MKVNGAKTLLSFDRAALRPIHKAVASAVHARKLPAGGMGQDAAFARGRSRAHLRAAISGGTATPSSLSIRMASARILLMVRALRHICAALLVLAFALGSATQAVQATDMAGKLVAASSSDKPMPDGCKACGDDDMSKMACAVVCAVPAGVLPSMAAVADLPAAVATCVQDEFGVGRTSPPDPFPPKPSLLV